MYVGVADGSYSQPALPGQSADQQQFTAVAGCCNFTL